MNSNKRIMIIVLFIIMLVLQSIYWIRPVTIEQIIVLKDSLHNLVQSHAGLSVAFYIGAFILIVLFGIPLSLTMIGGYLFGWWYGAWYSLVGTLLGVLILSVLVRYMIGDWILSRYENRLKSLNKEFERYGILYVLLVYTLPFMPNFLFHIAASVSRISIIRLLVMNFFGALPTTFAYSYLGSYITYIHTPEQLTTYVVVISLVFFMFSLIIMGFRWILLR